VKRPLVLLIYLLAGLLPLASHGQQYPSRQATLEGIPIMAGATDPEIQTFDYYHYIFVDRAIVIQHDPTLTADRHELLLFLDGTQLPGDQHLGKGPVAFFRTAEDLGYHVIYLSYPNDVPTSAACNDDEDRNAFERFRMAIIAGGHFHNPFKDFTITRADSIENRMSKLLLYLKRTRRRENWDEFLNADDSIKWQSIALVGQSQGGGEAALMAIQHEVARVICFGAPKDYNHAHAEPAAWYREQSATPKNRFFALNHDQDFQAFCPPPQQMENLAALGLNKFGPAVDPTHEKPPYHHTRIFTTDYPGGKLSSPVAHRIFLSKPDVFKPVWIYVLSEPLEKER
jgi:pimeloyl-ACP methyl ester carboxylesterase